MNPNVPTNPSQMLPPSLLRQGQATPGQIFQQNPLANGMSPSAMGADPSLMQTPQAGSQATNPMMQPPPGTNPGQPQLAGQPQPLSEAEMILNTLSDRLAHHSKITEKTVATLQKLIEAGIPQPDPNQASNGQ